MNKVKCHQESDSQLNRKGYNICVYEHSDITIYDKKWQGKGVHLKWINHLLSTAKSFWYGIKTKIKIKQLVI